MLDLLARDNLYVYLAVAGDFFNAILLISCCPYSHEMSCMRSRSQLNQFLRIFLPTLLLRFDSGCINGLTCSGVTWQYRAPTQPKKKSTFEQQGLAKYFQQRVNKNFLTEKHVTAH